MVVHSLDLPLCIIYTESNRPSSDILKLIAAQLSRIGRLSLDLPQPLASQASDLLLTGTAPLLEFLHVSAYKEGEFGYVHSYYNLDSLVAPKLSSLSTRSPDEWQGIANPKTLTHLTVTNYAGRHTYLMDSILQLPSLTSVRLYNSVFNVLSGSFDTFHRKPTSSPLPAYKYFEVVDQKAAVQHFVGRYSVRSIRNCVLSFSFMPSPKLGSVFSSTSHHLLYGPLADMLAPAENARSVHISHDAWVFSYATAVSDVVFLYDERIDDFMIPPTALPQPRCTLKYQPGTLNNWETSELKDLSTQLKYVTNLHLSGNTPGLIAWNHLTPRERSITWFACIESFSTVTHLSFGKGNILSRVFSLASPTSFPHLSQLTLHQPTWDSKSYISTGKWLRRRKQDGRGVVVRFVMISSQRDDAFQFMNDLGLEVNWEVRRSS